MQNKWSKHLNRSLEGIKKTSNTMTRSKLKDVTRMFLLHGGCKGKNIGEMWIPHVNKNTSQIHQYLVHNQLILQAHIASMLQLWHIAINQQVSWPCTSLSCRSGPQSASPSSTRTWAPWPFPWAASQSLPWEDAKVVGSLRWGPWERKRWSSSCSYAGGFRRGSPGELAGTTWANERRVCSTKELTDAAIV